jgi:hypothetical protein
MEKMTKQQKVDRKAWLGYVRECGGIVHSRPPVGDENGFCLVAMPCVNNARHAKFYDVSFAWCADNDNFDRKIGEFIALERFMLAETTKLPGYIIDNMLEMDLVDTI